MEMEQEEMEDMMEDEEEDGQFIDNEEANLELDA